MMRPNDAMEKVLEGLRDVKAPVGMERRILERLGRVEECGRVGWRPLWLVGMARPGVAVRFGVGVAVLIACVFGISVVHRVGRAPVGAKLDPARMTKETAGRVAGPVAKPRRSIERLPARVDAVKERTAASVESDIDSVAMSEMRAASFPAPPLPLTEQERLLLRVVHRGDPVELAMLDPKVEALRDEAEKAEFQRFFVKPAVKLPAEQGMVESAAPAQPTTEQGTAESTPEQPVSEPAVPTEKASPTQMPVNEPQGELKQEESGTKQMVPQETRTGSERAKETTTADSVR